MAVDFGSISNTTYASRTNTTITAPSGIEDDDVLYLFHLLGSASPPTPTPPAGFVVADTPVGETYPIDASDGSFILSLRVWRKTASGESGDYTVTHSAASSQGVIVRVTGADTGNPSDPLPSFVLSDGSPSAADTTVPSITTEVDGALILLFNWDWADTTNNLTPPTGTTPTFTERLDTTLCYVATGILATAGATGSKTMANNASSTSPFGGMMFAIVPAAAVEMQQIRPDADVTTTGWTITPLFSKINDESDATVITATAS